MISKFLLVGVLVVSAEWQWVKGGDMCAAIKIPCSDQESCTAVAYGPCEGDAEEATSFLHGNVAGVALTKDDSGYLECANPMDCEEMEVVQFTGSGYRDFSEETDYAYTMVGGAAGDMSLAGAYIGTASYLAKAQVKTNRNDFYVAADGSLDPILRGDSDIGAPLGPYSVCISDTSGGQCGAERTFEKSTYKFSIFGHTSGSQFASAVSPWEYVGVRTQLSAENIPISGVTLNNGVSLEAIGSTDVTKLVLKIEGGEEINIDFPLKYNYGTSPTAESGELAADGTKNVKIRVSAASQSSLYIDYLFDLADLSEAGKYFVYDPDVTVKHGHDDHDDHDDHDEGEAESEFSAAGLLSCGLAPASLFAATALFV